MQNDALISIIVPVFNRVELLKETIDSVLLQSASNWELILVDDGSSDGADIYCEDLAKKNKQVHFFRNESEKKGASSARNTGARHASGKYLFFLDSDDLLGIDCIKNRNSLVEKYPDLDYFIIPMLYFKKKKDDLRILQNIPTSVDPLDRFLKRENPWLQPMWSRIFFREKLIGYSENYLSFQDWDLNVRALLVQGEFNFFDNLSPDVFYRQHDNSISHNRYGIEHAESNLEMLLNIYELLKSSTLNSDQRRKDLAGFFIDVLNRFRYFEMKPIDRRHNQFKWLQNAVSRGLILNTESNLCKSYLSWSRGKLAAKFIFIRNQIDRKFRDSLLRDYFKLHEKQQGKIRYDGPIS